MAIYTVIGGETVTKTGINEAVINADTGKIVHIENETSNLGLYNGTKKYPVWVVEDGTVINAPKNTSNAPIYGMHVNSTGNILRGSTVSDSVYDIAGTGIYVVSGGGLLVDNSLIHNNDNTSNDKNGAGLYASSNTNVTITGSTFSANDGYNGGAMYVNSGSTVYLGKTIFDGNKARNLGGAFRNQGTVVLTGEIELRQVASKIDNIYNGGTILVDAVSCLEGKSTARVVNASATGWYSKTDASMLSVTDGYKLFYDGTDDDMYVTAGTTDLSKLVAIVSEKGDVFSVTIGDQTYNGLGRTSLDEAFSAKYSTTYGGTDVAITNPVVMTGMKLTSAVTLTAGQKLIAKDIVADGLTSASGGVVFANAGSLTLVNANISKNIGSNSKDPNAAIVVSKGGSLNIQGGEISKNTSAYRGGAISAVSAAGVLFDHVWFEGNTAQYGGAFFLNSCNSSWTTITGCTFFENYAKGSGGATYSPGSKINIYDTLFYGNVATTEGGALHVNGGTANVYGSTFTGNQGNGSAICMRSGVYTFAVGADGNKNLFIDNKGNEAVRILGGTVVLGDAVFRSNAGAIELEVVTNKDTGATSWGELVINGLITLETASDTVKNAGTITIDENAFFAGKDEQTTGFVKVIDANSANWFTNTGTVNGNIQMYDNDMYIYRGDKFAGILSVDGVATKVTADGSVYFGIGASTLAEAKKANGIVVVSGLLDVAEAYTNTNGSTLELIGAENSGFHSANGSSNGGAFVNNGQMTVSGVTFSQNVTAADHGGAIYNAGTLTVSDSLFYGNYCKKYGSAISSNGRLLLANVKFSGNTSGYSNLLGAAIFFNGNTAADITLSDCSFENNKGNAVYFNGGIVNVDNTVFSGNSCKSYGSAFHSLSGTLNVTNSLFSNNKGFYAVTINGNVADKIISDSVFVGNEAGAIKVLKSSVYAVTVKNTVFSTVTDTIFVDDGAELIFTGNITLNASLSGNGTYTVDGANFTIGQGVDLNGVDFSKATITVDGTGLAAGDVVAANIGGLGKYVINNKANAYLELAVVGNNLVLKELDSAIADNEVISSFSGTGTTVISGGTVNTFIGQKTSDTELIANKIDGGQVDGNLIGGAFGKASELAENTIADIGKTELNIGGEADVKGQVYAGGYFYGIKDAERATEAQMIVGSVNIALDGGKVNGNLYAGIHARQNANVKVDEVNISINGGEHDRVYAGGWAEGNAQSTVDKSTITIDGGKVNFIYGGGANGQGKTYVGATTITVRGDAEVGTIFMSGRYGYSSTGAVELNWYGQNDMKRLSGVSSAGVDNANSTTVNLFSDLTVDGIDFVDKFVLFEGVKLNCTGEFLLGNRNDDGTASEATTFEFLIGDSFEAWDDAISGISDFEHALFSVNDSEAVAWGKGNTLAIGSYTLTRTEESKNKYSISIA